MKMQLILLPGMLCDGDSWAEQISALSDVATCEIIDYGLARTQMEMAQLVLSRVEGPFAVAGHSLGGRVALQVQRLVPERVTHLGLFGTSADGHANEEAREAETQLRQSQLHYARENGMRAFAESWAPQNILPAHLTDERLMNRFHTMVGGKTSEMMESLIHSGLTRPDMMAWLPDITAKTLVLAGENDAGRPPHIHKATAAAIPNATLCLIPNSGHMVMMEQPQAVSEAMRIWLH